MILGGGFKKTIINPSTANLGRKVSNGASKFLRVTTKELFDLADFTAANRDGTFLLVVHNQTDPVSFMFYFVYFLQVDNKTPVGAKKTLVSQTLFKII